MSELKLAGLNIGVTASRRASDQIQALERLGAKVLPAPTMRIVPVEEDTQLLLQTQQLLEVRPKTFFVTTGQGINSWLEILSDTKREEVLDYLANTQIICRGSKGRAAIRKWGLPDAPSSELETSASMVDLALELGIAEGPIGLQRHGYVPQSALARLGVGQGDNPRSCIVVAPYRWELPVDQEPALELIKGSISGKIDAITFTAAPAVESLFLLAEQASLAEELKTAFETTVTAVAVGHVTAEPLKDLGIEPLYPSRERLGAMLKLMAEVLGNKA